MKTIYEIEEEYLGIIRHYDTLPIARREAKRLGNRVVDYYCHSDFVEIYEVELHDDFHNNKRNLIEEIEF